MILAVDSSVLFDLLLDDPQHGPASRETLGMALRKGPAVVCAVVYAELAAHFDPVEETGRFLDDLGISVDRQFEAEALIAAANAWAAYGRVRPRTVACPACGAEVRPGCPACGEELRWRQHTVPDFLIAGHAQSRGARLLTRDRGFYRRYFPRLDLLVPGEQPPPPARRSRR